MRFLRWPLLFVTVYGLMWTHAKIKGPSDSPLSTPDIGKPDEARAVISVIEDNPRSKESLSYALSKVNAPTEGHAPASLSGDEAELEKSIQQIRSMKGDPDALYPLVQAELKILTSDQVVERSLLMREAYLSFDNDFSPQMGNLLEEERDWLVTNISDIQDPATLQGYVQEISRFSIQNAANAPQRKTILMDMIQKMSENPEALKALRSAVLQYAEWDLPELIQNAPPEAVPYLIGNRP